MISSKGKTIGMKEKKRNRSMELMFLNCSAGEDS